MPGVSHSRREASAFQLPKDVASQILFDLAVSRHGLTYSRTGVLIPVVACPVSQKNAPSLFQAIDQVKSLHAMRNSATRRTPGIRPLVSSSWRSFRFS
jgi:hypothetical protein